jgi:hypothetical protein
MTSVSMISADPRTSIVELPLTKDIFSLEVSINSNSFDAFDLHNITKKQSLYFMM